jgi:N-acetylmuramoyl-L-alanine amidase
MKLAKYFGTGAVVAGVAVFSLMAGAEDPTRSATPLLPPTIVTAPLLPVQVQPVVAARPAPARAPVRSGRNRSGRRGGFRDINRYPGPIPTPDDWKPPEGPVRIALQAGHWKAHEAPPELSGLKDNGTKGGGKAEWEVNLAIARVTAEMLEQKGYVVDILPAVVPPDYRAHLFISIHADGAADERASGFRVAGPRRDATGRATQVVSLLEQSYRKATGLKLLPDVTRRMENYYAFNFRRYEHALHPMTIAVILETGFLTNPSDRTVIVSDPQRVARGIVDAVMAFEETPPPAAQGTAGGGY